jgi:hypothetical protein
VPAPELGLEGTTKSTDEGGRGGGKKVFGSIWQAGERVPTAAAAAAAAAVNEATA